MNRSSLHFIVILFLQVLCCLLYHMYIFILYVSENVIANIHIYIRQVKPLQAINIFVRCLSRLFVMFYRKNTEIIYVTMPRLLNFNWTIHCLDTKKGTKI